jgi:uncharacterized membrane protein
LRYKIPLLLSAILIALSGVGFAAVHFAPVTTTVSVTEAITITNGNTAIALFPDECAPWNIDLANAGGATVTVNFTAAVTGTPVGGSAADVSLTPSIGTVPAHTTTTVTITVCASNGAVPGDYAASADFQRA